MKRPSILLLLIVWASHLTTSTQAQTIYEPYLFNVFAGNGGRGFADGTGSAARFYYPAGLAVDVSGNIYVADGANHAIRTITPAGVVSTAFAGGPVGEFVTDVAVDSAGNTYFPYEHLILKLTPNAVASIFAGNPNSGSTDGTGQEARFNYPEGITIDQADNLYIGDTDNSTIRKITPAGVVTTLAGLAGVTGSADGTGSAARFRFPRNVAIDNANNLYVSDTSNGTVRKITSAGVVTTLAGLAGQPGSSDGTGSAARFESPEDLAVDGAGKIYVTDYANHTIRAITPEGVVTTFAGLAGSPGSSDGMGTAARFNLPRGLTISGGNIYVGDTGNGTIRKITPTGLVSTFAGSAGGIGSADGTGRAARFSNPSGVALSKANNVYVADYSNSTIRKISADGMVSTLAGLAVHFGYDDGVGSEARFNYPWALAVDENENVYVADSGNFTIRKITAAGVVTTFAGAPQDPGSVDGPRTIARFNDPEGIAVDSANNIYVADTLNHTIRKIASDGMVEYGGWFRRSHG